MLVALLTTHHVSRHACVLNIFALFIRILFSDTVYDSMGKISNRDRLIMSD